MKTGSLVAIAALAMVLAPAAFADEPECYDAAVKARVVHQVPTEAFNCGTDCVIMDWPWFLDLDVKRVVKGDLPKGILRNVLSVQHTWFVMNRDFTWWLRKDSDGGFNLVGMGTATTTDLKPCAADAVPPHPYIRADGRTREDLRREAEAKAGDMAR